VNELVFWAERDNQSRRFFRLWNKWGSWGIRISVRHLSEL